MAILLSKLTRNELLDFIFHHPVDFEKPWHFEKKWEYECKSLVLIEFMTSLFSNTEELINNYSYEQIDQGFWFIPGPNGFMWSILDEKIPKRKRSECIESVYHLFTVFFSKYNVGSSIYMWWDSFFTYCVYGEKTIVDDLYILKAVTSTIKKISHHEIDYIKKSADHGKEHLIRIIEEMGLDLDLE